MTNKHTSDNDSISKWVREEIKGRKTFQVDTLVVKALREISIDKDSTSLLTYYIKSNIETILNSEECYSIGNGNFVKLKDASLEDLKTIDGNFVNREDAIKKVLRRVREYEAQIEGQQKWKVTNGNEITGESIADRGLREELEEMLSAKVVNQL